MSTAVGQCRTENSPTLDRACTRSSLSPTVPSLPPQELVLPHPPKPAKDILFTKEFLPPVTFKSDLFFQWKRGPKGPPPTVMNFLKLRFVPWLVIASSAADSLLYVEVSMDVHNRYSTYVGRETGASNAEDIGLPLLQGP